MKRIQKNTTNQAPSLIGFTLLQPFTGMIMAFKNYRASWAKNMVWLFVIFYGFTFVISNGDMDANRIRDYFNSWRGATINLESFFGLFYADTGSYVDLMQPSLMFIVSRFTDNYRILLAVFAFIFGYFYSRNIWYLLERSGKEIQLVNVIYVITFAFIIGFWSINGFRMWTAAHVFFFGAVRYLFEKKKTGFMVATFSIFIHFSFILPVVVLLIHSLLKKNVTVFYWFFVVSFFLNQIDLGVIRETLIKYLPEALQYKAGYANEEYAERIGEMASNMNWYAQYSGKFLQWTVTALMSVIYFSRVSIIKRIDRYRSLFGFILLFLAVVNLVAHVPSMGRFYAVGNLFALTFIFLFYQKFPLNRLTTITRVLSIPFLLIFCVVALRMSFDTIGVMTIIGNPIIALFGNIDIALIDLIK